MAGRKKVSPGHWIDLSDKKQVTWIENYLAKKQAEWMTDFSAQSFLTWCKNQTDVTEFETRMRGAWAAYKSRKNNMQKGMVTIKIHKQTHEMIQRLAKDSGSNAQEVIHEVVEKSDRFIKEAKERLTEQSEEALAKRLRVLELTADKRRRKDELLDQIKNLEIFIANLEQVIRTHSERRALLEHHNVAEDNIPEELFDRINQLTKDEFCNIKKPLARISDRLGKISQRIYGANTGSDSKPKAEDHAHATERSKPDHAQSTTKEDNTPTTNVADDLARLVSEQSKDSNLSKSDSAEHNAIALQEPPEKTTNRQPPSTERPKIEILKREMILRTGK